MILAGPLPKKEKMQNDLKYYADIKKKLIFMDSKKELN